VARHPGKSRCCSPAQPAELFARSGPRSRLIVLATNVATGGTGKCRRQALTDQVRSWELKGELDVEPEIEGVLGADPGIKGIFGGDLEIAGVLVGKYGRTAVGSGAFPLWQSLVGGANREARAKPEPEPLPSRAHEPDHARYSISHNVYYVRPGPARASRHASCRVPADIEPQCVERCELGAACAATCSN